MSRIAPAPSVRHGDTGGSVRRALTLAGRSQVVLLDRDQRAWLELIRDHIATSLSIEPEDFEFAPFNQRGGLGRAAQLFGGDLDKLLDEFNEVLAA